MTGEIFLLILWIVSGFLNAATQIAGETPSWLSYWCCYTVLIIMLVERIVV